MTRFDDLKRCSSFDEIQDWISENGMRLWENAYPGRPAPTDFAFRRVEINGGGRAADHWTGTIEFSLPPEIGRPSLFFRGTGINVELVMMTHIPDGSGWDRHRLSLTLASDEWDIMAVREKLSA